MACANVMTATTAMTTKITMTQVPCQGRAATKLLTSEGYTFELTLGHAIRPSPLDLCLRLVNPFAAGAQRQRLHLSGPSMILQPRTGFMAMRMSVTREVGSGRGFGPSRPCKYKRARCQKAERQDAVSPDVLEPSFYLLIC